MLFVGNGTQLDDVRILEVRILLKTDGGANVVRILRDLALQTANAEAAPVVLPASVWQTWTWRPYDGPNLFPAAFGKENQVADESLRVLGNPI
jgi:hypothetical protein